MLMWFLLERFMDINVKIEIRNFYQLVVQVLNNYENVKTEYAYYVYKNNEIIDKIFYSSESCFSYNLSDDGEYYVRVYIRNDNSEVLKKNSTTVTFTNVLEENNYSEYKKNFVIYGVSKDSAFIKLVLEKQNSVQYFLDSDLRKVGEKFFGIDIKSDREQNVTMNSEYTYITANKEYTNFNNSKVVYFNYSLNENNYVLEALTTMSLIELYRLSRVCHLNGLSKGANFIRDVIKNKFNSHIPYTAIIGNGTKFGYGGIGVVVHAKSIIGENCKISQNVTIGSRGPLPKIGNNVFIGPGSKCLCGSIGNNVVIGANSVVIKDIPDNCVVAGVPAKIISTDIEKYSRYFNK